LKQKAQKQCAIREDNVILANTGENRAGGEELAPDSDPEGTKYVSVGVQSKLSTLTALFTRAPSTQPLLSISAHLRGMYCGCQQSRGTYNIVICCEFNRHTH
jgi:hypothetical protein